MKATRILKENVAALLRARNMSHKDLAHSFLPRRSESWISKIYREERRSFSIHDLDHIADVFGYAGSVYKLFQPGVSLSSERRVSQRRNGLERRIGHAQRALGPLRAEVEAAHPRTKRGRDVQTPEHDALQRLLEEFDRRVSALLSQMHTRGQAAAPRDLRAGLRKRDRKTGGPDDPKS